MPVDWTIHPSGEFAVLSVIDPYTFEEWSATVLAMLVATGAENPKMSLLVDRRRATPPSSEEVRQMVQFFERNRRALSGRSAAVVVSDDGGFGMARMIELRSRLELPDGIIRAFRSYDDAVVWLTGQAAV